MFESLPSDFCSTHGTVFIPKEMFFADVFSTNWKRLDRKVTGAGMKWPVKVICLPCTINVAALEWTEFTLLWATHLYFPLSVLFTFVMLSCLLPADKLILSLSGKANPPLVQENVGSGTPFASLEKVTLDPCTTVLLCGCSVNWGLSVIRNYYIIAPSLSEWRTFSV